MNLRSVAWGFFGVAALLALQVAALVMLGSGLGPAGDSRGTDAARAQGMVRVAAGEFLMGSITGQPDEQPARRVYLDTFEIDRFEVTNADYLQFVTATGHRVPPYWEAGTYPPELDRYPVVAVAWADADAYCRWTGERLPTEAEWEKACRGPDGQTYPWGDAWNPAWANVDRVAGPSGSPGQTRPGGSTWDAARDLLQATPAGPEARGLRPVGSYPAGVSRYGVMDMVGNAAEWVADYYNWEGYAKLPVRNPLVLDPPWNHVLRGSAWYDPAGDSDWVRSQSRCAARNSSHAVAEPRAGFRCARSVN